MEEPVSPREAIARWAEDTQALLDEFSRVLEAHDQLTAQVQALEERAARLQRELEEARRERTRLERVVAQLEAQRHAAPPPPRPPITDDAPRPRVQAVAPTAATGPRRPPVIRFTAATREGGEPGEEPAPPSQ